MPAEANLTKSENLEVKAREIDFVTRFARNWEHLRDILGIMRPIKKQPGYVLKSKTATVTLQGGNVEEGSKIPYSQAKVVETDYEEMTVEKYAKAVSLEAIKDHGYDVAVAMTDDAFLFELQTKITSKFYAYLNTGTLNLSETTWQRALAMAKGAVINEFKKMHRTATNIVGFVNVMDLYDYMGDKDITIQSEFGFNYIKNFLGYSTVFLLSEEEIKRGRVIATPVENIVNYYLDPSDSDFTRAGLSYTTDGETNLIGFHTQGNYSTAVSECFAIMGNTLFAEYKNAIAVADVDDTPTLGTLTVTLGEGDDGTHTKLNSVSPDKEAAGNTYRYKVGKSENEVTVTYGQNVSKWKKWDEKPGTSIEVSGATDYVFVVEADSEGKAQASGKAKASVSGG